MLECLSSDERYEYDVRQSVFLVHLPRKHSRFLVGKKHFYQKIAQATNDCLEIVQQNKIGKKRGRGRIPPPHIVTFFPFTFFLYYLFKEMM